MPDLSAAKGFTNDRKIKTKPQGDTFHRIPKHKVKRQAWSQRRKDLQGNDRSVPHSCHLKAEDFDMTGQKTRLKDGVTVSLPDHLWKVSSRSRSSGT